MDGSYFLFALLILWGVFAARKESSPRRAGRRPVDGNRLDRDPLPPLDASALAEYVRTWRVQARPAYETTLDAREIARIVSGWGAAGERGGDHVPSPTLSPRSDPLWDRELDG